jgi:glutamate-1-semialdehyde 2,1-aminomutase
VDAGSGVATFDINTSPGVPKALAYDTLTSPYNDVATIKQIFEKHGDEIACVIVEPVAGNMGVIPGTQDFLQTLRELTQQHGSILIFDEVMSGFRAAYHGAQSLYGIQPDMTTLGKVVGGGLPVGVFGGRRDIMKQVAPQGPIYHAGTLSGNPLAMTGGISTLEQLTPALYDQMTEKVDRLAKGIEDAAASHHIPIVVHHVGTMWSYFFNQGPVNNFDDVQRSDMAFFAKFFNALLTQGIYTAPSEYETNFISSKHTDDEIDQTIAGFNQAFDDVLKG